MKKWGQVAMLVGGAMIALWAVLNAILLQGWERDKQAAENSLREQLGVPASTKDPSGPPPAYLAKPPADTAGPQLAEDLLDRWRKVFDQVGGTFYRDDKSEVERFRQRLCLSYERPFDWSITRMNVLEEFQTQNEALTRELITLTKLGVPSPSSRIGVPSPSSRIGARTTTDKTSYIRDFDAAIHDCVGLLTVMSAIEARRGSLVEAGRSLSGALRLMKEQDPVRVIFLTALDVSADEIFRSGSLSAPMLSELEQNFEFSLDRQYLVDCVKNDGRYLLWESRQPLGKLHFYLDDRAIAFAQKTLLGSLYTRSENRAFEHASRLAALASQPYYQIRDELAVIEREAQPQWYDSTVPRITDLSLTRDFVYQARWEARHNMIHVAILLEEYFEKHNAYPESLDAVTAALVGGVPSDIFTGGDYHYLASGDGFILYSSGKNGMDDAGEGDDVVLRIEKSELAKKGRV